MSGERGDCYASEMTIREKIASQVFCVILGEDQRENGIGFLSDLSDVKGVAVKARIATGALLAELAKPQEVAP